jgi:hypothetical protein
VASEADAIRVKNDHRAGLSAAPGAFGLMVRRNLKGEWIIQVLVDQSVPLPADHVLDGVPVCYVYEERPRPLD